MKRVRSVVGSWRFRLGALAVLVAILGVSLLAHAATPIPVPEPLVIVTTKSGTFTRTTPVPIGGVPVPIDVDGPNIAGLLEPDIDVSIGLVAIDELPGKPIVPNVVIRRNALAVATNRPAPPLDIDARVVLRDANDSLNKLVEIHYGYVTPPGAKIPPVVTAKLVGPIQGGFIDPLQAKVESPGYSGPLDLKISALTKDLDAKFRLNYDALPESIFISEDPREDGLDALYTHVAPVADVHLEASASMRNLLTNDLLEVGANLERVPQRIALSNTNTESTTLVNYDSSSALNKPDLEATYRDTDASGKVITNANVKVAGLPFAMKGQFDTVLEAGKRTIDKVDFNVLNGDEIGAVDFLVRNYEGPSGNVPAPELGPEQFVAVSTRQQSDSSTRFRAAGRLLGIRSVTVERQGADNDILDARTDIGNGVKPLRAILDLDNRGPGGPGPADAKRMKVDTTLTPLPRTIHAVFDPSTADSNSIRLLYESSSTLDIGADAIIAKGSSDGCGQPDVICAKARVDKVPRQLEALLPGVDGTDFSLSHNAGSTQRPDVRATVDATDKDGERVWAKVGILRVPNEVTGRLSTANSVLKAAEFHGCKWNFAKLPEPGCTDAQAALGRVTFTVRDQPSRGNLPPRPDTAKQFVTLLSRDDRFEAAGAVDEVRNVVFHQRDDNEDGKADGTLGVLVDTGNGSKFDAVIDDISDFPDPDDTTEPIAILGKGSTKMNVTVDPLPSTFSACVRANADPAPPAPGSLSNDTLLAPCDRDDVLGRNSGDLTTTPLSILYKASQKTKVTAKIQGENPDKDDPILPLTNPKTYHRAATVFETTIDKVPAQIRTDVIAPVTPDPAAAPPVAGRKLELDYDASDRIGRIDFGMETRRADSICEDPRPDRLATCLSAVLTDLPDKISVSYDPDDSKGDIDFRTEAPKESNGASCSNGTDNDGDGLNDASDPDCVRLSINKDVTKDPMRLSIVDPDPTAEPLVLDARITDITDHLAGKLVSKDVDGEGGLGPAHCSNSIDDDTDAGDTGGGIDAADEDCGKDMAQLRFDACPDGPCPGIGQIWFKATNALIGDPLPQPVPATSTIPGVTQDFSFIQREDLFRAQGSISQLKRIGLSKLKPDQSPSATTQIEAAFGSGLPSEKIRAYVDTDSGAEQLLADAVIAEAPAGLHICLRDALPGGSDFSQDSGSSIFCDTAESDQMALQVALDTAAGGAKPDIDVRQLRVASAGGTNLITGNAQIANLGERVDVMVGKQAKDGDLLIEGHSLGDDNHAPSTSDTDNVADRVTFDLRNRDVLPSSIFPWISLENSDGIPANDTTEVDSGSAGNDGNFLKFHTDAAGRFHAKGSVPDIRKVAKRNGPCTPGPRFPTTGFPALKVPAYSCLDAQVAGNKKLGLSVRTRDAKSEVLEVEEGLVTAVPSGGLHVTLGKSPDAAKLDPICGEPDPLNANNPAVPPCRPPMLSLEAPRTGAVPSLLARLSTGNRALIVNKLMGQVPDDVISKNTQFEQAPSAFPESGARVKVGTDAAPGGGDLLGIRMTANLPLHQFLDLNPPTLWSCKHTVPDPDPATQCTAPDSAASSDENKGYESKDIFFKLVASDSGHDGFDVPFLGRVAVLVQDYKEGGTQTVLSGPPTNPDNNSWFHNYDEAPSNDPSPTADPVTGADSHFPERLVDANDPSHRGFRVPGHLDARVYLRNDYNASGDDDKQQNFAQVDGRVNSPLTMAVRLNDGTKPNRHNQPVPPVQLTIRNAPGGTTFNQPTFRVRAELKKGHVDNSEPGLAENVFTCRGEGYGIEIPAFLTVCLILPTKSQAQWLDVGLNMDPNSNGNTTTAGAARTVDAVAGPFGGKNQADLRGFSQVNGTGGDPDVNKGPGAAIVPQAGLRLTNFKIGLKVGVGFFGLFGGSVTWVEEGDLVVGLTGDQSERARLYHNLLVMNLTGGTSSHRNRINTNLQSIFRLKVTAEALFGLVEEDVINETIGPFHHDVIPRTCAGNFLALGGQRDQFTAPDPGILSDGEKAAIALGTTDELTGTVASTFSNLLTGIGSQIFCLFTTDETKDVNSSHPAPRYTTNTNALRPIENGPGAVGGTGSNPPTVTDDVARHDVTIDSSTPAAQRVRCGALEAKTLTVASGVTLRVGRENETDGVTGENCEGRLNIDAERVVVNGTIDATGARNVTSGPGVGSFPGGGGGHAGKGGNGGGGGGAGGFIYAEPSSGPFDDFGSRGASGSGAGATRGNGGGVVRIASATDVEIGGLVLSRGSDGGDAPAPCSNIGGGGGSGGAIEIIGSRVFGGGTVSTTGGQGGNGPRSGGGGGGGRITITSVTQDVNLFSNSFGAGTAASNCDGSGGLDNGTAGDPGTTNGGTTYNRAAGVFLHADNPGPFVKGSAKVTIRAAQRPATSSTSDNEPLDVILCRRYLAPEDTNGPFEDPALDPGGQTLQQMIDGSGETCQVERFSDATDGEDGYVRTVTVNLDPLSNGSTDGFYGFYAIATRPPDTIIFPPGSPSTTYCLTVNHGLNPDCSYQREIFPNFFGGTVLPQQAQARIGSDTVGPTYDTPVANRQLNGFAGCPDSSLCLADSTAKIKLEASDRTSGIDTITCTVTNGPGGVQQCPEGPSVNVSVGATDGTNDGLKTVNVHMEDNADDPPPPLVGNVSHHVAGKWFTDGTKPNQPDVVLGACGGGLHGWCTSIPSISATASDNNPSSGFEAGKLEILIDEAGAECGSAAAGSSSGSGTTGITCPAGTVNVLTEGRHVITAIATDRLGNESVRAEPETMRVDKTDPNSAIFLGPKKPDGLNDWYVTKPFFAFGATDKAGGSKVDPDVVESGVFYAVDGGTSGNYLPSDFVKFNRFADLRLGDGVHEICWYAVDVAGNAEADGDPKHVAPGTNCKGNIKVDTVAPNISDPVTPATPNGDNSFYITTPTSNASSSDPLGVGVNSRSGVNRTEMQIDGADWFTAAPTPIAEGEHEVRSRSFDNAGNPSPILERTIRVDKSDPSAIIKSYPPQENEQGWFRRHVVNSISSHDGRDGSGADSAQFSVDSASLSSYLEPFPVVDGIHTVNVRARDYAGRQSALTTGTQRVDTLAPFAAPTGTTKPILIQLLGLPSSTQLAFTASDQLSPRVKVRVWVYDELGRLLRRLDAPGSYLGGYRDAGAGTVTWDGRNSSNQGVLPGLYHYRVLVIDQAGNTMLSTESKPFAVVAGVLPR